MSHAKRERDAVSRYQSRDNALVAVVCAGVLFAGCVAGGFVGPCASSTERAATPREIRRIVKEVVRKEIEPTDGSIAGLQQGLIERDLIATSTVEPIETT